MTGVLWVALSFCWWCPHDPAALTAAEPTAAADGEHGGAEPERPEGDGPRLPEVAFTWREPPGQAAVARCRTALARRGSEITAEVVPAAITLSPVHCFLLDGASFQKHFGDRLPDWGIGVALPDGRTLALDYERIPEIGRSVEQVFLHELTHAVIFQAGGDVWLPAWFHEGAAMWHSGEWRFTDTVALVLNGTLPSLWRLQDRFPAAAAWADQAYRTSLLAYETLRKDYGPDVCSRLIAAARRTGQFETAFLEVTGDPLEVFVDRFAGAMKLRFGWLFTVTRWPTLFVLLAAAFLVGAALRAVRNRRRLAAWADDADEGG